MSIEKAVLTNALALDGAVMASCQAAREFEEAGEFESARATLSEVWCRVGDWPDLKGLGVRAASEVLLRVGTLTGKIGSAKQIAGAQELGKDLIGAGVRGFDGLGLVGKVVEAQTNMAYCYLREAAYDEARVLLSEAILRIGDSDAELLLRARVLLAQVERCAKRLHAALEIHNQTAELLGKVGSYFLHGIYSNEHGAVLIEKGLEENDEGLIDTAFIEFESAAFNFERAGNVRYQAAVINNLSHFCLRLGRLEDATRYADKARGLFMGLRDTVHTAQVDETKARILLAHGKVADALKAIKASVRALERGDEKGLLIESLNTYGVILFRAGDEAQAVATLLRARAVSLEINDKGSCVRAIVTILEVAKSLDAAETQKLFHEACGLSEETHDAPMVARLLKVADRLVTGVKLDGLLPARLPLREAKQIYERELIAVALREANGKITKAAQLLGMKHQRLSQIVGADSNLYKLKSGTRKVVDLCPIYSIELPPDTNPDDVTLFRLNSRALSDYGARTGDRVAVDIRGAQIGDLVGVTAGGILVIGHLVDDAQGVTIQTAEGPVCFQLDKAKVAGRVIGYCKAGELAGEDTAKLYPVA